MIDSLSKGAGDSAPIYFGTCVQQRWMAVNQEPELGRGTQDGTCILLGGGGKV